MIWVERITASSVGILPNQITRWDVKSGSRAPWLYRPGMGVDLVGVDISGRPLIIVLARGKGQGIASPDFIDSSASELLIGLNSTSQRSIYKGPIAQTLTRPIADSHGIWFGSQQGIYLYSEAKGLQKVSNQPGNPANGCF